MLSPTPVPQNIFVVTLNEQNAEVINRLEVKYPHPHAYKISDTCYLVATFDLPSEVATNIGLKGDDRIEDSMGAVFKLNGAYSGYSYRTLWDWISQAEEISQG